MDRLFVFFFFFFFFFFNFLVSDHSTQCGVFSKFKKKKLKKKKKKKGKILNKKTNENRGD